MDTRRTIALLPVCLLACTPLRAIAGDEHTAPRTIVAGGRERTYLLHVPPNVEKPAPVVLAFHGGGGRSEQTEKVTGLSALSDREGFIVVYPDGVERHWYDGRDAPFSRAHRERIDDVGFVRSVLDSLGQDLAIDERRIYATGISNGAFFAHYLGANLSGRIAAIAPIVGGMADPFHERFKPEKPVSVLIVQGTEDPLVPYDGGGVVSGRRGRLIDTNEAARLWVAANGCRADPVTEELPDRDPEDGCKVLRSTWPGGRAGSEVVLLRLVGGGHTWPSGPQYLPQRLVGRVCRDIDSETIWEFFRSHPAGP